MNLPKRIVAVCSVVFAIAALRPIYISGVRLGLWQPLMRPAPISARARYVPSLKTEAWFDCSVDAARNIDVCRAWDPTGNLIAFGDYRLDGENRAATAFELQPVMVQRYPGHPNLAWIDLGQDPETTGKTLVPIGPNGKPLERFDVNVQNGRR